MRRTLFADEYAEVTADEATRIVWFKRTSVPLPPTAPVDDFFVRLGDATNIPDRARWRLLIDLRDGPSRNDPQYEAAFARHRPRILGGFERRAVLVRSAVGKLQVARLSKSAGIEEHMFTDEAAARAWLLTGTKRE